MRLFFFFYFFFLADPACLNSSTKRRLVLYLDREMPSHSPGWCLPSRAVHIEQPLPPSLHLPPSVSAAVFVLWSCSCSLTSSHCSHFPSEGGKKILQTLLICSHTPSPLSLAELLVLLFRCCEMQQRRHLQFQEKNFQAVAGTRRGNSLWFALSKPLFCISWGPQFAFSSSHGCHRAQGSRRKQVARGKKKTKALVLCDNIWEHMCSWDVCTGGIPRVLCRQKKLISYTHIMLWAEKDLKDHLFPAPLEWLLWWCEEFEFIWNFLARDQRTLSY